MKIYLTFEVEHLTEARELLQHIPAEPINVAHSHKTKSTPTELAEPTGSEKEPSLRKNVKPKGDRASRVGSETQEATITSLQNSPGLNAAELNEALRRSPGMLGGTVAVLNLLVDRGVIKFDGERYYV